MREQIRFFAIGLLTASILIFVFYSIIDESDAQVENIPLETLVAQIEADGYRVITEEEFIDYSFYIEEKNNEENDTDKKTKKDKDEQEDDAETEENRQEDNDEENEEEEEDVTTITLTVSQGDVSQDIAAVLEDNDIIDDAFEFVQYLEDNDYSPYIQLGSFEISSDMTRKEIAETITTFPGS